jgi:hypothetical protein
MIGFGLASTHASGLFCPIEVWPRIYNAMPDYMKESQPHTAKLETEAVIASYKRRGDAAFEFLRQRLRDYKPDAVVVVGDDQGDLFNLGNNPALSVFVGKEVWGSYAPIYLQQHLNQSPADSLIHIPVHSELATYLLKGLTKRGFDAASSNVCDPQGPNRKLGVSHAVVRPMPKVIPELDIPIIPVFLNEYFPPLPTGQRCWELGRAIAEIFAERPERVAIWASGGLSHDNQGPRAGWIDEPLDRWVLERVEQNRGEELVNLFTFDSAALRGGTGEIRSWIVAAGACRWKAVVLDYIASSRAKTGLGWAYWPSQWGPERDSLHRSADAPLPYHRPD